VIYKFVDCWISIPYYLIDFYTTEYPESQKCACAATDRVGRFWCTREVGHSGKHVAHLLTKTTGNRPMMCALDEGEEKPAMDAVMADLKAIWSLTQPETRRGTPWYGRRTPEFEWPWP
jgi:hypothetical protein